jgi:hypothetical protein
MRALKEMASRLVRLTLLKRNCAMMNRLRQFCMTAIAFAAYSACAAAMAQQPAGDAALPSGAAAAAAVLETNPAVRAALEWPRTRPADALRAICVFVDLGRTELAQPILAELQARNLSEGELAALVKEFGSHRMLQLAREEKLAPAGGEFSQAAMSAAAAEATNPARLRDQISRLGDPSALVRELALTDLASAGQTGAIALLEAMAVEGDAERRSMLGASARRLRPLVDGPLLAMLETNDPALRAVVAGLLSEAGVPQAAPLLAPASSSAAQRDLVDALDQFRRGAVPFALDGDDRVELWHWDDGSQSLSSARYPAEDARILWMARLAERLAALRPQRRAESQQAIVLRLEADGRRNFTLPRQAAESGEPDGVRLASIDSQLLSDVLSDALKRDYTLAAAAAIDEMARRGDARVLLTADGQPSPLADALVHAERRVRWAALRAIVALDPASPYPGSSRVPDALAWFARGAGIRQGLVAMPTVAEATDLAGKLSAAGIEAEGTNRGADVARLAQQMPDLELVLVDMDIIAPNVRQVLYELRITPATGRIPVALLATEERLAEARRLAGEHERVVAVPLPATAEAVTKFAERLLAQAPRDAAAVDERAAQALEAVAWMAQLLGRGRSFYALRREAPAAAFNLFQSSAAPALDALARMGTPFCQQALVVYASQPTLPIDTRRQAAAAFDAAVKAHGLLLTRGEILAQYDLYNASADADANTQEVLGALLDAMEQRRSAGK